MSDPPAAAYGIAAIAPTESRVAPTLPYRPAALGDFRPAIGLVGCGGVSEHHLAAYRQAGYRVVALCDRHRERAQRRQEEFFPAAAVYDDVRALLAHPELAVVDLTPHPLDRLPIMEAALQAGKHVLSQKPFVLDLDVGHRLVTLAAEKGRRLAVNQNGRWAPHFSYLRQAVAAGLLGRIVAVHLGVHWNHHWIVGTRFEAIHHLVLYDFGIHWFDLAQCLLAGHQPRRVFASVARSSGQTARPPLLAQALIEYDDAQASLVFDADTRFGPLDHTFVVGTEGTAESRGPDLQNQQLTLSTKAGMAVPALEGRWFPDGFQGAMAELLLSIAQEREPSNSARGNLPSLALCFAALASANTGKPVEVGSIRQLPS